MSSLLNVRSSRKLSLSVFTATFSKNRLSNKTLTCCVGNQKERGNLNSNFGNTIDCSLDGKKSKEVVFKVYSTQEEFRH